MLPSTRQGKRFTISDAMNSRNDKPFDWPLFCLTTNKTIVTVNSRNSTHRFHNAVLDCVALTQQGNTSTSRADKRLKLLTARHQHQSTSTRRNVRQQAHKTVEYMQSLRICMLPYEKLRFSTDAEKLTDAKKEAKKHKNLKNN